jgi:ATP-dependent helicase/nuclease subunit B
LGPSIDRLDTWLSRLGTVAGTVLSQPARELVLADALRSAARIYAATDPWQLAGQLLTLFDELTRNAFEIPDNFEQFHSRLKNCYAVSEPSVSLQQEAYMLHTLWHAWKQQLADEKLLDPATANHQRLANHLRNPAASELWLIGYTEFSPGEIHWLRSLLDLGKAHLLLHGGAQQDGYHPDGPVKDILDQLGVEPPPTTGFISSDLDNFISALFETSSDNLQQRARDFARQHPQDTIGTQLKTFRANDPEQEAQAVALQVRRWLLEDIQPIAIVTEDRRLARRVRAMLEASQIELDDSGGWALSTTSAAATLERWLETVEEDFACGPLLDVLKSPFVCFTERDEHLAHVRRLEQDIILHENIARGLDRYRHHLDRRSERLPDWSKPMQQAVHQMLNVIDHAASPLVPLLDGPHPANDYLAALYESLQELSAWQCLAGDLAGQRLLEVLEELQQAAGYSSVPLEWSEFRNWLGRNLERTTFRLPPSSSPVRLLTLEQSRLQRFAATIVAGCSRDHMPGSPASLAFFNQRVRSALGLPTWSQTVAVKLHHFCRVLHSAKQVLLTCHTEREGEPVSVSPWLELLEVFYHNAYHSTLDDTELGYLVLQPQAYPVSPDTADLPELQTTPAPRTAASMQPGTWSVYTHQRLIDCPYRYFSADTLGLKPQDEIREALSKSDYGSLVHSIVQAFHCNVEWLPGPWSGELDESQRGQATQLLEKISRAVFREAVKDNFQARSWLNQWLTVLPGYIDWEILRQREWKLHNVEFNAERNVSPHLRIRGRIDRVDRASGSTAIVDYKTGKPPGSDDVLSGEAVQLPSYALLLDEPVTRIDYLEFSKDKAKQHSCAEGERLQQLLHDVGQRLTQLDAALQESAALPAWGDPKVCGYCEFTGICRRDMWVHGDNDDD